MARRQGASCRRRRRRCGRLRRRDRASSAGGVLDHQRRRVERGQHGARLRGRQRQHAGRRLGELARPCGRTSSVPSAPSAGSTGTSTARNSSSAASAVSKMPVTKPARGMRRSPRGPSAIAVAPRSPAALPPSRPPDRHAPGCRRSCRGCAPADTRCGARRPAMISPIRPGTAPSSIAACVVPAPMRSTASPARHAGIVRQVPQIGDRVGLRQPKIEQAAPATACPRLAARRSATSWTRLRPVLRVGHRRRLRASSSAWSARHESRQARAMDWPADRTPRRRGGASASLMAFTIAAGGPIAPLSPMPFWPNVVQGLSVSIWSSRTSGTSVVPGSR